MKKKELVRVPSNIQSCLSTCLLTLGTKKVKRCVYCCYTSLRSHYLPFFFVASPYFFFFLEWGYFFFQYKISFFFFTSRIIPIVERVCECFITCRSTTTILHKIQIDTYKLKAMDTN